MKKKVITHFISLGGRGISNVGDEQFVFEKENSWKFPMNNTKVAIKKSTK
jgi:hypothetical protein